MKSRLINLDTARTIVFGLFVLTASPESFAVPAWVNNNQLLLAEQRNPWLLPEKEEKPERFGNRSLSDRHSMPQKQSSTESTHWDKQEHFVTPEILDSLKRQQSEMQRMPQPSRYYQPNVPPLNSSGTRGLMAPVTPQSSFSPWGSGGVPLPNNWELPASSMHGSTLPSFPVPDITSPHSPMSGSSMPDSMGFTNPLYDVPSVSPWADDIDLLYHGETMPWVPDEALGGIPPIPVSPYLGQELGNYPLTESYNVTDEVGGSTGKAPQRQQNNVFNPFTFIPNKDLQ